MAFSNNCCTLSTFVFVEILLVCIFVGDLAVIPLLLSRQHSYQQQKCFIASLALSSRLRPRLNVICMKAVVQQFRSLPSLCGVTSVGTLAAQIVALLQSNFVLQSTCAAKHRIEVLQSIGMCCKARFLLQSMVFFQH